MRRKLLVACAVTLAVVVGVASASAIVPSTKVDDSDPGLQPDGGSTQRSAPASDPDQSGSWSVRIYTSQAGKRCAEIGRTAGDTFGRTDSSGKVEALPVAPDGVCTDMKVEPYSLAVQQYAPRDGQPARVVVFGLATGRLSRVTIVQAGARRDVPIDPTGSFIAPLTPAQAQDATIQLDTTDGPVKTYPVLTQAPGAVNPATVSKPAP